MIDKRIAHTQDELFDIFKEKQIEEKYFSKFLDYYKVCYGELDESYKDYEDDDFNGGSVQESALFVTNLFIDGYLELMAKGHSDEWAYPLAHDGEFGERDIFHAYSNLHKINPQLAKKELLIHANSISTDPNFLKHYIYLFEVVDDVEGRIASAKNYAKIYKEELKKGKSEIYARQFAFLMADGYYNQIYCEDYAIAYEKAIKGGKSIDYAETYGDKYGSALVDIKRRHGISDDEEMIEFAIEKVDAFMKAWEYAQENKLENFLTFASIYESNYFDTYYPDDIQPIAITVDIDKIVLEKTINNYENIKKS